MTLILNAFESHLNALSTPFSRHLNAISTPIYQVLVAKAGADPEAVNDAGVKPKRVEEAIEDEERDQEMSEGCKQQ